MKKLFLTLCLLSTQLFAEAPLKATDVKPLLPGTKAPIVKVKNQNNELIELNPESLSKPYVLTFYRGGWCPYCNAQLAGLRKAEKELLDLGFDVFFISADSPEHLVSTLKDQDLKKEIDYQLLSDASMKVSQDFGVAFKVDDPTVEKYKKWNIDLEKASGYDHHLLPVPAIFIVSQDGKVNFMYAIPDYSVRLDSSVLLAAATSLKDKSKK